VTGPEARYLPASEPQPALPAHLVSQVAPEDGAPPLAAQQEAATPVKKRHSGRRSAKGVQTLRGWFSPFDVFIAHKMGMRKDAIRALWGEQAAGWATSGGR
jgi:hypothetical protein